MMALKEHAGYYTLQDKLLNILHDELSVEITKEQADARDADAPAAEQSSISSHDAGLRRSIL